METILKSHLFNKPAFCIFKTRSQSSL